VDCRLISAAYDIALSLQWKYCTICIISAVELEFRNRMSDENRIDSYEEEGIVPDCATLIETSVLLFLLWHMYIKQN